LKWEVGMRNAEGGKKRRWEGIRKSEFGMRKVEKKEGERVRRWEKAGLSNEDCGLRVTEFGRLKVKGKR
jgi:hypothetical protein